MGQRRLSMAMMLALACGSPARAQDGGVQDGGAAAFHVTLLSLSADGEVQVRPDLATVNVGVGGDAATAAEALASNRTRMAAVVAALHRQGVADPDIQTSELNLEAQYIDDGKSPRRLSGYHSSNTVTVRLHDLTRAGPVLDALVAAGADQVNGVAFALADPLAARDQARRLAMRALQAKAELYASAAGYRIQRLVHLSEGGEMAPAPMMSEIMVTARRASTPVEGGELTVRAQVTAEYELTR